MQKPYRFIVSALLLGAILLSACSGAMPTPGNSNDPADANSNEVDDTVNSNDDSLNTNSSDDNSNGNSNDNMDDDGEVYGIVEAITIDSVTINGVTYTLDSLTEFKDMVVAGDQVKFEVIVNADGTLTILKIELSSDDDDDSNSNSSTVSVIDSAADS